jgi:hypothetical protein
MNLIRLLTVLTVSAVVFGCATTPTPQATDQTQVTQAPQGAQATASVADGKRKSTRTVAVAKEVGMPPYPQVIGPAANTGVLFFGVAAIAVMANTENSDSVQFRKHLDDNKIDLRDIVRQEFISQLKASNAFAAVVGEGAQANFDLEVKGYGLTSGFSMRPINKPLKPILRVAAKLSTPDGKVLWENSSADTGPASYQMDGYLKNPAGTELAFKKLVETVVKDLLANISDAN